MRRVFLLLLLPLFAGALPAAAEDNASIHRMVDAQGELDTDKCALCHAEDFSLLRPKAELCTACHATTVHSGAAEHLRASAASVARRQPAGADAMQLPLTEDGRIYCGTCHLFHDPAVAGEQLLPEGRRPAETGPAASMRQGLMERLNKIARERGAEKEEISFSAAGTRALRLPVADGSLCKHCHGYAK